jgi:hypothetical protein
MASGKRTKTWRNAMKARLFGTMALLVLPSIAFAADAGNSTGKTDETTPAMEAKKIMLDDKKGEATSSEPAGKVTTPTNTDAAGQSPKTKTP